MSPLLLTWIALIAGILTVLCLVGFLVTGKNNAVLRVSGGILCIVTVISGYASRM